MIYAINNPGKELTKIWIDSENLSTELMEYCPRVLCPITGKACPRIYHSYLVVGKRLTILFLTKNNKDAFKKLSEFYTQRLAISSAKRHAMAKS